jgi:hypothetical protein
MDAPEERPVDGPSKADGNLFARRKESFSARTMAK